MDDWASFSAPVFNDHGAVGGKNSQNKNPVASSDFDQKLFTHAHFQKVVHENQQQPSDEPTFELEKQPDTIDATTGQAVCFAIAANWIVIGTSHNNLIRWYIGGDQDEKNMLCLSTKPEERIFEIFLSPNGKHILISMINGTLYYIPTNSDITKPIQIQKFKDIVQSVAWYQYDSDMTSPSGNTTTNPNISNSVQRLMLGTTTGSLWELVVEDSRERSLKKFYELNSSNSTHNTSQTAGVSLSIATAITGIRVVRANIDDKIRSSDLVSPTLTIKEIPRWHLFFVTSSHEYKLSGGPTIESMFSALSASNSQLSFIELPGELITSNQLTTFAPIVSNISPTVYGEHLTQALVSPQSYGWLTAAGVYYTQIDPNCPPTASLSSASSSSADQFTLGERLIEFPKIQDQDAISQRLSSGDGIGHRQHYLQPISILLTEFHVIFLFRQHLAIVNLINGTVVMSCPLPKSTFGATRKLAVDEVSNSYWLLTDTSLYEIFVSNEGKDIWRLYLSQGDYESAYQHCSNPHQSKIISTAHADSLFSRGDYIVAAQQFIRSTRTFESVCMKYLLEYQQYNRNTQQTIQSNQSSQLGAPFPFQSSSLNQTLEGDSPFKPKHGTPGMPQSLFTPTLNSLFGPNQLASNSISSHKLFSASGNPSINGDTSGIQSNNPALSFSQDSTSSLSLLLAMTNSNNSTASTSISAPSCHEGDSANSNLFSVSNPAQTSYTYINNMFQILEKKWSIYSGLKTYLKLMLSRVSQIDKTKLTTLSTWVVEISVNTLVSLQTSFFPPGSNKHHNGSNPSEVNTIENQRVQLYNQECIDLEEFIEEYIDCLHPTTTYQLLSTAGRTKECLFYAKLNKHYGYVLDIYLREKLFLDAIDYLRSLRTKPSTPSVKPHIDPLFLNPLSATTSKKVLQPFSYAFSVEPYLIYRIIPTLLQHYPSEMVDLLIETDGLQSIQVLTAMVRSGLHIEFITNPDTIGNAGSVVLDPSKKLLHNTLQQYGVSFQDSAASKIPNEKKHDIAAGLHNPTNIKSITGQSSNSNDYVYHVSRYLVMLISMSRAPPAAHNLYIAILVQLLDPTRLYNYLISHKHTTSPNRVFAIRLALPHVEILYSSVIELCLQLQRHTLAIRFALRYDTLTAKRILKTLATTSSISVVPTMNFSNTDSASSHVTGSPNNNGSSAPTPTSSSIEQSLWQEYVQLLFSNGHTIGQIIQDIRSWSSDENDSSDLSSTDANNTALLKILPCLPPTTTISDIQSNIITQLVDFNTQLNQLNLDMNALHLTNNNLKSQLNSLQQQIVAISTAQRCDICSQPVLLSPFIYFRCGHVFHLQCCINSVVEFFHSFSPSGPVFTPSVQSPQIPAGQQQLSKKQTIFMRLLNDLHEDLTTTASLSQTAIQEVDQHFCTDEMIDLVSIQELKHKVLSGILSHEEELFFIEEYAQQSCCHCGDLMIESIGLQVQANTPHSLTFDDSMDWSL
jgi:hypothetical protein